jgi:MYXO-CTERM domain-containing protein
VRRATADRESAIAKANADLATAKKLLEVGQTTALQQGLNEDGESPEQKSDCMPGYKLNKVTNRCEVDTGSPALPWILGGAAVLALFLLRRK